MFCRILLVFVLLYSSCGALEKKSPYRYELAVVAIFQDEAPYMKEWIEFHKLVGVQHFYLLNNLSSDDYMSVLAPYVKKGEVEIIDWPYGFSHVREWRKLQPKAYEYVIFKVIDEVKWLAIIDLDEFLFPVKANNLAALLNKEYSQFAGVVISWQVYGTSNVEHISETELMIEKLTLKAPEDFSHNLHGKSIVQPKYVLACKNPHSMIYKDGYFHVNTNKNRLKGKIKKPLLDVIRINHYWTRDEEHLHKVKIPRQKRRTEATKEEWEDYAKLLNKEVDLSIMRFVPALRKAMGLGSNEEISQ